MGLKKAVRVFGRSLTAAFFGALFAGAGFLAWLFLVNEPQAFLGAVLAAPLGVWLGWRHHERLSGWGDGLTGLDI